MDGKTKMLSRNLSLPKHGSALQIRAIRQSITASLWPLTAHIYHVMIIVTGGFSKKYFLLFSEATSFKCYKKFCNIQRKTFMLEPLFNKVVGRKGQAPK